MVERLARGCAAACFAGDDAGDLAAFAALDRLALGGHAHRALAVADEETPPELVAAADIVARGPAEALALFRTLGHPGPALDRLRRPSAAVPVDARRDGQSVGSAREPPPAS